MTFGFRLQQGTQQASAPPPPPPTNNYLMGVSNSNNGHGGINDWDVLRVYSFSKDSDAIDANSSIVALTDEPLIDPYGGQASANLLNSRLTTLFNTWPNLEVHWANGNEIDIDGYTSAYLTTCAAMRTVIDNHRALGHNVSFWIDLTTNQIRTAPYDEDFKPVAQYLDGIGCSMYPPGRKKSPLEYTDYDIFIKPIFDLALDWGIFKVACWEIGIGPDTNTTHPSSTNETATYVKVRKYGQSSLTQINVNGTKQVRPAYTAYMAKYIVDIGQAYGIETTTLIWWDQQKSASDPDNVMSHDPVGTSPTTAQSWKNWENYVS